MARWVDFLTAQTFSAVKNKYKQTGSFGRAVRAQVFGAKSWGRRNPLIAAPAGPAQWEVDVAAIPRVRPLTVTGVVT